MSAAGGDDAGSFVTTLSVHGREHQHQTGLRVTVTPLKPPRSARASIHALPPPGLTPAEGSAAAAATSAASGVSAAAAPAPQAGDKSDADPTDVKRGLEVTSSTFGEGGMTVVGFWEPGRGFNPLGALHLIAGEQGEASITLVVH